MKTAESKHVSNSPSCVYLLGMIGASIYFISNASGFWAGVLGFLKALVWPVYMVLEVFEKLAI